jgi:hypothetical protein
MEALVSQADFDTRVKLEIYGRVAETTRMPTASEVAGGVGTSRADLRLYRSRVLVLEPDQATIRMAPPFSGVPTQHLVRVDEKE